MQHLDYFKVILTFIGFNFVLLFVNFLFGSVRQTKLVMQGRRQVKKCGVDTWRARAYNGGLEAEPLIRGQGAKPP